MKRSNTRGEISFRSVVAIAGLSTFLPILFIALASRSSTTHDWSDPIKKTLQPGESTAVTNGWRITNTSEEDTPLYITKKSCPGDGKKHSCD